MKGRGAYLANDMQVQLVHGGHSVEAQPEHLPSRLVAPRPLLSQSLFVRLAESRWQRVLERECLHLHSTKAVHHRESEKQHCSPTATYH